MIHHGQDQFIASLEALGCGPPARLICARRSEHDDCWLFCRGPVPPGQPKGQTPTTQLPVRRGACCRCVSVWRSASGDPRREPTDSAVKHNTHDNTSQTRLPPHDDPAPAVHPRQWRSVAIVHPSSSETESKSKMVRFDGLMSMSSCAGVKNTGRTAKSQRLIAHLSRFPLSACEAPHGRPTARTCWLKSQLKHAPSHRTDTSDVHITHGTVPGLKF